jgi:hypothetical protein
MELHGAQAKLFEGFNFFRERNGFSNFRAKGISAFADIPGTG